MPHSLKSKVKSLCYKGEITEKERDRIIKALEQTELNPSYNGVKTELEPCEEENPTCTECRYYDKEKHHCPRFCRVIENTMVEITSEQPRWIPVSERLPKENEYIGNVCKYYLVQDEYGDMHVAHLSNVGWIPMDSLKAIGDEVIAWMPLPEPYEESEDEE